jgi:hypothetical protein
MSTELPVRQESLSRLDGEIMKNRRRYARPLTSYIPVATALVGVTIVLASVVFFFAESDVRRLVSVTLGLAILIVSVWFAANPFRRGVRRYRPLRREVEYFLALTQVLNKQVVVEAEPESIARTKAKMHDVVDRMVLEANKTR